MKNQNCFRFISIIVLLLIAGSGSFAQYVGPTPTYDAVLTTSDYVTIGSRVPYYVTPDAAIAAMRTAGVMNYSAFSWRFTTNADVDLAGISPLQYDGDASTNAGLAGYIVENEVSVVWGGAGVAEGSTYNVRAIEHSNPLSGIADGCEGDEEIRNVIILPRPTLAWGDAQTTGCGIAPGAAATFYVPLNVTGLGEWEVTYSVTYNGAAYIATTTSAALGTATAVTSDATVVADAAAVKNLEGTPDTESDGLPIVLNGGGALNGFGYYDVTITNITDRISRKSLDMSLVASQAGDVPAAAYRIYVNPTPNTQPIQHLQNL